MVGSSVFKYLTSEGYSNLIYATRSEVDLTNENQVDYFFKSELPEVVILCAAKVGGIQANINNPVSFLLDNIKIQNNIMSASLKYCTKKFIFLGSSCIYPKESPQPMKEEYLLTGQLEPTNEGYALAKIVGIKLLQSFKKQYGFKSISLMPCNLYGPNDSFDPVNSHVLSALVKKFVDAKEDNLKEVILWGTGIARREFLHVNDLSRAIKFLLENFDEFDPLNVGSGFDISIRELADLISKKVGYRGIINWDDSKPDGMLRKCLDVSELNKLGFYPQIPLSSGIDEMINLYKKLKLVE